MMTDGAFAVSCLGRNGVGRKMRFESTCGGHLRIEVERTGVQWREIGAALLKNVAIETADDILEFDSR
jgi:hypothetical protein